MKQRPDPTVFREFIKFSRGLNAIFMQTAPGPAQTAFSQIYRPRHPPRSQTGKENEDPVRIQRQCGIIDTVFDHRHEHAELQVAFPAFFIACKFCLLRHTEEISHDHAIDGMGRHGQQALVTAVPKSPPRQYRTFSMAANPNAEVTQYTMASNL